MQLAGAIPRRVPAPEAGQFRVDPVEVDPVAAIVARAGARRDLAAGKLLSDDPGQLADTEIVGVLPHVEHLAPHRILRRDQAAVDGLADVFHVHDRTPRAAVAGHGDPLRGPCEGRQVIDDDIEAHPRRRPITGRIAQEHRAEVIVRHRAHIPLHQDLALRVCGLRVDGCGLVQEVAGTRAIDAAGRRVDEPADARLAGGLGQADRAEVIDLVSDLRAVLAERIVGQFGQVHHRITARQVLGAGIAQILVQSEGGPAQVTVVAVQPAIAVIAAVQPDNLEPALHQIRAQYRADIAVDARDEYLHSCAP
jgi:hypothetical protein